MTLALHFLENVMPLLGPDRYPLRLQGDEPTLDRVALSVMWWSRWFSDYEDANIGMDLIVWCTQSGTWAYSVSLYSQDVPPIPSHTANLERNGAFRVMFTRSRLAAEWTSLKALTVGLFQAFDQMQWSRSHDPFIQDTPAVQLPSPDDANGVDLSDQRLNPVPVKESPR